MRRLLLTLLGATIAGAGACNEAQGPPVVEESVLPDSAEQLLVRMRVLLTSDGVRRAEMVADTAYMYQQNTLAELRQVHATFFTATGEQDAVLTSREGTYNIRLNSMEARGDVVVVSTDGRRLETPQLRYDPGKNEFSSDSAFVLTDSEGVTEGVGFVSDPDMTRIQILAGARTRGRAVTIPRK